MLMSSLLLVSLWGSYQFVVERGMVLVKENEVVKDLLLFDRELKKDFYQSQLIHIENNKLILNCTDTDIQYFFQENMILRKQNKRLDTLALKLYSKTVMYEANIGNLEHPVKLLDLEIMSGGEIIRLVYLKKYNSVAFFNNKLIVEIDE